MFKSFTWHIHLSAKLVTVKLKKKKKMKQQQHPNKKVKMPGLFDGFVAINQLPKNNEVNSKFIIKIHLKIRWFSIVFQSFAAYILTRPFDLTTIRAEHANKIYTTINLKWGMIYNEEYNVSVIIIYLKIGISIEMKTYVYRSWKKWLPLWILECLIVLICPMVER